MRAALVFCAVIAVLLPHRFSAQPLYQVEREQVPGGGELLTIIRHTADAGDVPLISILRDTLGDDDPENDCLRYVWVLTAVPPGLLQETISALPFTHFHAWATRRAKGAPKPFLDMGAPSKDIGSDLMSEAFQLSSFERLGVVVQLTTRAYGGNRADHRKLEAYRAMAAVEGLLSEGNAQLLLRDDDLHQIYSRLSLSARPLGALVREESLERYYQKQTDEAGRTREHNWELLRQRAEFSGLYFDPIPAPDGSFGEALVWIARRDLYNRRGHRFDGQFLKIRNPWTDQRLLDWRGYSQIRYFDAEHHLVTAEQPGASPIELIPLALYSLEYPRVPFVLIDFRNSLNPRLSDLSVQDANMFLSGILAATQLSNWPFLVASGIWRFVRTRHGATLRHDSRLQAYSEAQEHLTASSTLNPDLKIEMLRRIGQLFLGPLENSADASSTMARDQYSLLQQEAVSASGLSRRLNSDRQNEMADYNHSAGVVAMKAAGRFFTRGSQKSGEDINVRAKLDSYRRAAYHIRFLHALLNSGSAPEVRCDPNEIRKSIEALIGNPEADSKASRVITQLLKRTQDSGLRMTCLRALATFNREQTRKELEALTRDPHAAGIVRTLCRAYLQGTLVTNHKVQNGMQ